MGCSQSKGVSPCQAPEASNPKPTKHRLQHTTSVIDGVVDQVERGNLPQKVVHFEVPFGKPIAEVYNGVHSTNLELQLGEGIGGIVRRITHKVTGLEYAVKILDKDQVKTSEGIRQLQDEIRIMCQLDHPNIVRLHEVYESSSELYLVQELCRGGDLFDRLENQSDYCFTESECARLTSQMLCAVQYLHAHGIIHRDLKLENFVFRSKGKDSELKMIDFGLSKIFQSGDVQDEQVGTQYTVAPEVLSGCYDQRCDIWSIGVVTFLLFTGDPRLEAAMANRPQR